MREKTSETTHPTSIHDARPITRSHLEIIATSYHCACLVAAILAVTILTERQDPSLSEIPIWLLVGFSTVLSCLRYGFRTKYDGFTKILARWVLLFEYVWVLLIGYVFPHLLWIEYLLIPAILIECAAYFPMRSCIPLEILLGVVGSTCLSSTFLSKTHITLANLDVPLVLISASLYVPLSLMLIAISWALHAIYRSEQRCRSMLEQNSVMNSVNRSISQRLFSIQQDSSLKERMRIVKEIHDTVGYVFINIIMLLQATQAIMRKDLRVAEAKIDDTLDIARRGMNEIRSVLREIRSYEKPSLGLQNELYEVGRLFTIATEVDVHLSYGNWKKSYGAELDNFFISFLQESFTNALKHGRATIVEMNCWETQHDIIIAVKDNGSGSDTPVVHGIGISGIDEYVRARGGRVDIDSQRDGFLIRVSIPSAAINEAAPVGTEMERLLE